MDRSCKINKSSGGLAQHFRQIAHLEGRGGKTRLPVAGRSCRTGPNWNKSKKTGEMTMKKTLALLLALVMLLALAACGNGDSNASNTDTPANSDNSNTQSPDPSPEDGNEPEPVELSGDPIKIGHIADLTGVEAMTGQEAVRSLEFAVKYIEAHGGIDGRPIEICLEDSQSNAATAADAARKLVEDEGVVAILGPTQAGHKSTVAGYVSTAGVPAIYYNGTAVMQIQNNEYVIGAGGGMPEMPTAMADYLYNDLGLRTICTITQDNAGGKGYMDPLIENFEALGGTVAVKHYTPVPTADFGTYLVNLPAETEALVCWVSGSDAIALWTAWYEMGLSDRMPMYGSTHGGFTDHFICSALMASNPDIVEAMLKDTIVPIMYSYSSDHQENVEFVEAWVEEYGEVPLGTNLPGACCQALMLLKEAIESIDGNTEPEALYQALQSVEVTGPEGHLYFEDGMRAATKDVHIAKLVRLEDGSFNYEVIKTYPDVPANGLPVG